MAQDETERLRARIAELEAERDEALARAKTEIRVGVEMMRERDEALDAEDALNELNRNLSAEKAALRELKEDPR